MNEPTERDLAEVRRELRIERAVIALVLHGYRGDTVGFNDAATDLGLTEHARLPELLGPLRWALARLPRGIGEPTELHDRLVDLYGIRDGD
ncbi:hypothetical protein J8M97_20525 [Gordonia polyisoprenivorans]|uniref:hypothetical protein n=1 Tax=Gordonia polyisoprenivorans TaxID=84595 RepID=UPI001B8BCA00|nr:hypothetical protein [Gordonia polyisoprenivorans]QUD82095.1 hypothetical protein J8M97_20525 [Gordonia polyisoprenivorans]